jgi:hypothetical protein
LGAKQEKEQDSVIPAKGLVEKGIDFNVTRNAFIKKHESILGFRIDSHFPGMPDSPYR